MYQRQNHGGRVYYEANKLLSNFIVEAQNPDESINHEAKINGYRQK